MKNLIEILGSTQLLLGINFDPDLLFEERLTDEHRGFLVMLRVLEEQLPPFNPRYSGFGRPRCQDLPIFRAYLAKHCYQIDKNNLLRAHLLSDGNLRRICGFEHIPSEATFSRRLAEFAKQCLPTSTLAKLVQQYHEGALVRVIARDSTTIAAREKPCNKKRDIKVKKHKRGRPRKDEVREPKAEKRMKRQLRQTAGKSLSELDKSCAWNCKTNSQGNPAIRKATNYTWIFLTQEFPSVPA